MPTLTEELDLLASKEVPQADDLHKVYKIVWHIHNEGYALTDEQLAHKMGIVERQIRYYKAAARILGFLDSSNRLTELGKKFVAPSSNFSDILVEAFEYSRIGRAWVEYYHIDSVLNVPLEENDVVKFLDSICPFELSLSTKKRRAQTLIKWVQIITR